jgi:gliding motility-associated-like protein
LTVRAAGTCRDSAATAQQLTISPRVDASFYSMPDLADTLYLPNARVRLTNTSNNADNATWFFGDGQIARSFNAQHTYEAAGTYDLRLLVTDAAGCKDDTVAKNIVVRKPALQLTNVFTPNGDGMNDRWPANYQGNEDLQLQIYDRWGNQVYASDDLTPGWDGTRGGGGEPVPEGTYFYRLRIGDKTYKGEITLLR